MPGSDTFLLSSEGAKALEVPIPSATNCDVNLLVETTSLPRHRQWQPSIRKAATLLNSRRFRPTRFCGVAMTESKAAPWANGDKALMSG